MNTHTGGRQMLHKGHSKRRLDHRPEPRGGETAGDNKSIFVIQEHDASTLHYDFRLEIGGMLKSWAVPKGPSTDPRDKRLAIETEDHPLEYADFEGVIPQGDYGAGTVLVWDRGTYRNLKTDAKGNESVSMLTAYKHGHLLFWLDGQKLTGGYALTLFRTDDGRKQWLLVKMDDASADARRNPVNTEPQSVLSGHTLAQIAQETQRRK